MGMTAPGGMTSGNSGIGSWRSPGVHSFHGLCVEAGVSGTKISLASGCLSPVGEYFLGPRKRAPGTNTSPRSDG